MQERDREMVLILGAEDRTRLLAGRVLLFDYRSVRAADLDNALRVQAAAPSPIRVGIIAIEHGLDDLRGALRKLARGAPEGQIAWIAFGNGTDPAELAALRQAGVRFALFEPFTDEELRFVLNQAHHEGRRDVPRIEERVPANLRARVETKTGEKVALVYNLSTTGAYLVTPRPTLRGGPVRIHLPLPAGETSVDGLVVWNNVPGNLRRLNAPIGMGVRSLDVSPEALKGLEDYVEERGRAYRL
jgi:hypothetical protein